MRFYSLVAAAALASASLAAHADIFYSYVGANSLAGTNFTIDSATHLMYGPSTVPVTTGTDVFLAGSDTGYQIMGVQFLTPGNISGVIGGNGRVGLFVGGAYDIGTDGTYTDASGDTLQISGSPAAPVAVTPEPSGLALLGTGLLGAVGVARKRFA